MGAIRRFFTSINLNDTFAFKVDTTKTVVGATDGSEKNNQFILPLGTATFINAILSVNDGRSDIVINNTNKNTARILTFSTPGIYEIKLSGIANQMGFNNNPDSKKIIEITSFSFKMIFTINAFAFCSNLIVSAKNQPRLNGNQVNMFREIKGFSNDVNLSTWDMSRVTNAPYMFYQISNAMTSIPQGFINEMTNIDRLYQGAPISTIPKIEIISEQITTAQWLLYQTNWRGELVMKTPNLTNISQILYGITNPPSLGQVDIRKVTTTINFILTAMQTINVDSTLLGWQNNFDWTGVTVTATYDFKNSKYSNNPAVIAAKAFLEAKGIVFTNLTMA